MRSYCIYTYHSDKQQYSCTLRHLLLSRHCFLINCKPDGQCNLRDWSKHMVTTLGHWSTLDSAKWPIKSSLLLSSAVNTLPQPVLSHS